MKQESVIVQNQEGGERGGGMIVYIRRSEKGVVSVHLTFEVADEYNAGSHLWLDI